ncbi:MAG: PilZ domain-containing protein [Candidatus Binatia bacterium]
MPVDQGSRISKRAALHRTAWLEGVKLVPCVIVDISSGGAQLGIPERYPLADAFSIRLTADGRVRRNCRLIWRRLGRVGVRFA